jgi:hypothetical protein
MAKHRIPTEREVRAKLTNTASPAVVLGKGADGVEVSIKFMGTIERGALNRRRRPSYRLYNGYSIHFDGRQTQPWLRFREAMSYARELIAK